jgi:hypothetical protein
MATRKNTDRDSSWIEAQGAAGCFGDKRLQRRFRLLLGDISGRLGSSIPYACQDWAAVKAAYRFLSNPRVSEEGILCGHFECTRSRVQQTSGPVLVLHDTTEFSYQRESAAALGLLHRQKLNRGGRLRPYTTCGLQMHSSMAVTLDGLPLGLTAVKFWTRSKFKDCNALKRKINPTRVPIEEKESYRWLENLRQSAELLGDPARCVHIGDREADIFELFCTAVEARTHFVFRTCADRLAGERGLTVAAEMQMPDACALRRLQIQTADGALETVLMEVRYRRLTVHPPIGKEKRWPSLELTVIHAIECGEPAGREPVQWKLLTSLPVHSVEQAMEKLRWYALRWKIEVFHKILKSGCKAEESQLRTAERLVKLIAVFCIVSWRIFWMTMLQRTDPGADADLALTEDECEALKHAFPSKPAAGKKRRTLSEYLLCIARLGGWLARKSDPPPGNLVMWRGLCRLADITTRMQWKQRCG